MEERILSDRIKKFNQDHHYSNDNRGGSGKIINAREKNNLQLRKNKLDEEIMRNRMINLMRSNCDSSGNKYGHLVIRMEDLAQFLPDYLEEEFGIYDQKYDKIQFYLEDYLEYQKAKGNENSTEGVVKEAHMRYGIMKFKQLSMDWNNPNGEDSGIDPKIVEDLFAILYKAKDGKIHYDILHILINIAYDFKKFTDLLIEEKFLTFIFELTYCKEAGVVNHTVWLFANLIESDEMCNIIINILPNFFERINQLLNEYGNIYLHNDIIHNITWLMYRILFCEPDYFDKFLTSIPIMTTILENEIQNKLIILQEMNNVRSTNTNYPLKEHQDIIQHILLIFGKITHKTEEGDIFNKFFESNLIFNLMKLIQPETSISTDDHYMLIFRIFGGLLTSPNPIHSDILLNYGLISKIEKLLEWFMLNNYYNKKILKEAAWTISNICAGTKEQTTSVIVKSKIPSYILRIAYNFQDPNFIKEVLFIFYNAYDYGGSEVKSHILCDDIVDLITNCLQSENEISIEVTKLALDFLKLLFDDTKNYYDMDMSMYKFMKKKFEVKNVTFHLEKFQFHPNKEISSVADVVLMDNWEYDEQCFLNS